MPIDMTEVHAVMHASHDVPSVQRVRLSSGGVVIETRPLSADDARKLLTFLASLSPKQRIGLSCGVTEARWMPVAVAHGWREALTVARSFKRAGLRVGVHGTDGDGLDNSYFKTFGSASRAKEEP